MSGRKTGHFSLCVVFICCDILYSDTRGGTITKWIRKKLGVFLKELRKEK